ALNNLPPFAIVASSLESLREFTDALIAYISGRDALIHKCATKSVENRDSPLPAAQRKKPIASTSNNFINSTLFCDTLEDPCFSATQ
ncbi:hypothetical protein, partial [Geitlerinema sp. P-1104]|uniref:hypothetical protein n=1 Tax=Geitlerinema sp. P-1104 TaxID=2546230 RepID=UPI0019811D16